jgi:hypothetical protein
LLLQALLLSLAPSAQGAEAPDGSLIICSSGGSLVEDERVPPPRLDHKQHPCCFLCAPGLDPANERIPAAACDYRASDAGPLTARVAVRSALASECLPISPRAPPRAA